MRRASGLVAAYSALTIVLTSPIVNFRHLASASYEGDARLLTWVLAWDAHALLTRASLFDANIFYPEPHALSYAEHHIGIGAFATPFYAATANAVLTYWILWLAAFPLNALAMHALAWRVTRDHGAAFAAGCIYAFCFFRMHHAHGHLQLLWTWMLPLLPLALDAWLDRPTTARTALVTALVLGAVLASWYLAVFVTVLAFASFACLGPRRALSVRHAWQAAAAALVGVAVTAWFARPYMVLVPGPAAEIAGNAADLKAYLLPPENTWLGQLLLERTSIRPRWIWGEQTLYVGMSVLTLSTLGLSCLIGGTPEGVQSRRIVAAVLSAGVLALAFSFGPVANGWGPFDLLSRLPGLSLVRAPARFALLVVMAAALLSALGVAWLRSGFGRRGDAVAAALLVLFFVESFVVAFPAGKPKDTAVPVPYRLLASLPRGAVLSLPTYRARPDAFREADYLLFSTMHWQPIVNGYGRQEPPEHGGRMEVLERFPAADSLALMRRLGIRYVVVHTGRASDLAAQAERARSEPAVRLIDSTDGDFLFEVR